MSNDRYDTRVRGCSVKKRYCNLFENNIQTNMPTYLYTRMQCLKKKKKKTYVKICITVKRIPESTKTVKSTIATGGERSQIEINGSRETNCTA